jgi:hypothetical protein
MAMRWMASSQSDTDRMRIGFASALARPIDEPELQRLMLLLGRARKYFEASPDAAKALLSDMPFATRPEGTKEDDPQWAAGELAAWSMVTSAILNLDEMLTRP